MKRCLFLPFILALLAGCGSGTDQIELEVWDFKYRLEDMEPELTIIDSEFMRLNPSVEIHHLGFSDTEYIPRLRVALLAGTGPDVMWVHPGMEFINYRDYFMDLAEHEAELAAIYRPESINICRDVDGTLKGIPLTFQGMGWYYNRELLASVGVDELPLFLDWERFLSICDDLKASGVHPITLGNNPAHGTDFIRRMLLVEYFSESELENFYKGGWGPGTERFATITRMIDVLIERRDIAPERLFRSYFFYARDSFAAGEAAFVPGLLSDAVHWKDFSDALGPEAVGYVANLVAPDMPYPKRQMVQPAGIIAAVNEASDHPRYALDYLMWLTGETSTRVLTRQAGALVPQRGTFSAGDDYPVLERIGRSIETPGVDIEVFYPSVEIREQLYRLDSLLHNSREIGVPAYLRELQKLFSGF